MRFALQSERFEAWRHVESLDERCFSPPLWLKEEVTR